MEVLCCLASYKSLEYFHESTTFDWLVVLKHFDWLVVLKHFDWLVVLKHFDWLVVLKHFDWLVVLKYFDWLVVLKHWIERSYFKKNNSCITSNDSVLQVIYTNAIVSLYIINFWNLPVNLIYSFTGAGKISFNFVFLVTYSKLATARVVFFKSVGIAVKIISMIQIKISPIA